MLNPCLKYVFTLVTTISNSCDIVRRLGTRYITWDSKVPQPRVDLVHMAASDLFMIYLFYLLLMQIIFISTTYDLPMVYL